IQGLSEKLEGLQLTRSDQVAVSHLEDRIAKLVEKLDASDARLGNLGAIERGLPELLVHLEQARQPQPAQRAAAELAHAATVKREVLRTQDSLEAGQGTLGHVVDRLAMIESGIRGAATPAAAKPTSLSAASLDDPRQEALRLETAPAFSLPAD